jgi:hypothetical protein
MSVGNRVERHGDDIAVIGSGARSWIYLRERGGAAERI